MFFKIVRSSVYKMAAAFSCFVTFFELFSMNPSLLTAAVERKAPLHIVTLTRATCGTDGNVLSDKYLPISAAEAVTIFAITNAFLGESTDLSENIAQAHKFDKKQFENIDSKFSGGHRQDSLAQILEQDLSGITGLDAELVGKIVDSYGKGNVPSLAAILTKSGCGTVLEMLPENILASDKNSNTAGVQRTKFISLPETITEQKVKGIISFTIKVRTEEADSVINITTIEHFIKIRTALQLVQSGADLQLKEKYFSGDPFLFGYLSIPRREVGYYLELYTRAIAALKERFLPKEACVFVANELFFGKNFILPDMYPSLIPLSPPNVLTCINFLLSESSKVAGTSFAMESPGWTASPLPKWIDTGDGRWQETDRTRFFRSVSFYKIHKALIQEYTKSSYYQECDSALKSGYTYLFGQRLDFPHDGAFINLLSTQICYDLQSKVRSKQDLNPALIHIFQSNTHELSDAISKQIDIANPSKVDIPGRPKIIIHADPLYQEVFVPLYEEFCFFSSVATGSAAFGVLPSKMHYTRTPPRKAFTFSIDKGDHIDSYTITHWVLDSSIGV